MTRSPLAVPAGRSSSPARIATTFVQHGRLSAPALLAAFLCADILGRLHEMLPYGNRIPIAKLLLPVGMLLLINAPGGPHRFRPLRTPQAVAFWIFGLATLLAVPASLVRGAAFQYMMTFGYGVTPYVILVACGPATPRGLSAIFRGVVICVICLAAVMFLGGGYSEGGRLSVGGTYDPNDIALVAVVCFPFATWLLRDPSRLWRLTGIIGAVSALLVVLLSASRGGMIATGVVLLFTVGRSRYNLPKRWKLLLIPGAALLLAVAPPVFWERFDSIGDLSSDYNMTSDAGRIQIWKRGVKTFLAHPIVGVGGGQFASADGLSADRIGADDQSWHTAHNSVVQIGVELGIFGLVGMFGMHIPTLRVARQARRAARAGAIEPEMAALGETLFLSIVGFYTAGMFLSAGDSFASFTLGALGMSYTALLRSGAGAVGEPATPAFSARAGGWRSARAAAMTTAPDRRAALPSSSPDFASVPSR